MRGRNFGPFLVSCAVFVLAETGILHLICHKKGQAGSFFMRYFLTRIVFLVANWEKRKKCHSPDSQRARKLKAIVVG